MSGKVTINQGWAVDAGTSTKIPTYMVYGIMLLCVIPYLLTLLGVDFGSTHSTIDHRWASDAKHHEIVDAHFHALSGAFTHTLFEWTAFCVAGFVVVLALSHYKITKDITTPVIGVALFMAGCMDAFHTLAADRLITAVADNRDLIPFTWAISRSFNALIMIVGVGVLLMRDDKKKIQDFSFVITVSLFFAVIAYTIITVAASTKNLPATTYPDSFLTRPFDAIPLILFVIAGFFIYPRLYKRYPSLFAHGLILSAIPEVFTQLHMTFGSKALFDSHFNIGHFLKIVAYSIPLLGLILDYIRVHSQLQWENIKREEVQAALMESETHQRAILDTVADSIITINDEGEILSFNPSAERMFGYQYDEVYRENICILIPEQYQQAHKQSLMQSSLQGIRYLDIDYQLSGRRKDGSEFPLDISLSPMQLSDGNGFVGILRDISEQKKSEQALQQFKTTLDQTMDCVFMFHPLSLKFFYVNAGGIAQVGYSEQELLAMTPVNIKPDYDENLFRSMINSMIQGSQKSMNFETSHQHKDGHLIPVEIFLQYIHPQGETARFVAMVRDISERQRIERMKDQFVSTVSHELRTPLTSIRGSLGLITGGAVGELPTQATAMLKIAENNTQRLLILINDILDIQKIETGEISFSFKTLMLMPFIQQSIEENAAYGEQYGVIFNITESLADIQLLTDKNRLMQVMTNLLSNAAKFSIDGGEVDIAVTLHNSAIRIAVCDQGMGIPEKFQSKLFDKFTQSDAADTRKIGGTGLGLSICKATVEKLGGKISFESSEGVGTTFYVDLPRAIEEGGSFSQPSVKKEACRILVIDIEQETSVTIQKILLDDDFQVALANTLERADQLLFEKLIKVDAITIDLLRNEEVTTKFIQKIRLHESTRNLPIIVISAISCSNRNISSAKSLGKSLDINEWLSKPVDRECLTEAVRAVTGTEQLPRILHVEDDSDVRQVVSVLLKNHAEVVAAVTVGEAKMLLQKYSFSLVLLDLDMPDCSGALLLDELTCQELPPKVVIFSAQDVDRVMAQKVDSVLLKSTTSNTELLQTVIEHLHDDHGFKLTKVM